MERYVENLAAEKSELGRGSRVRVVETMVGIAREARAMLPRGFSAHICLYPEGRCQSPLKLRFAYTVSSTNTIA